MFERFTEAGRQVIVLAQDEARELGHSYIGTEHLLLGVLRDEEGLAARLLASFGAELEEVRKQVTTIVGQSDGPVVGQIPFTARAKKVMELSLRESIGLRDNVVGPEHVVLALARVEDGVAARVMQGFGADAYSVRQRLVTMRQPAGMGGTATSRRPRGRPRLFEHRVLLLEAVTDLTDEALAPLGAEGWRVVAAVPDGKGVRLVLARGAHEAPDPSESRWP